LESKRDNDPAVLLTYIATAPDRVEPIDPGLFQALASPGVSIMATAVPRFVSAISAMADPIALILDHVELLENPACLDTVAEGARRPLLRRGDERHGVLVLRLPRPGVPTLGRR
jgi:hypothetical protein